jgi:hypothetical protein
MERFHCKKVAPVFRRREILLAYFLYEYCVIIFSKNISIDIERAGMNNLSEQMVSSYSTNAGANSNARTLVSKNAFPKLCISEDNTLIFGECEGSAKDNYRCSADFSEPESPVFRCSCPSRQIPCKHVLGLMYSYVQKKPFIFDKIPDEILEKRAARQKRKEQKSESEEKKPKQVDKSALKKKIASQLEGLEVLKKLLDEIIIDGLGTINPKTNTLVDEQIKNLGNYYLTGVQDWLRAFNYYFKNYDDHEKIYSTTIQYLNALYSIYKKGKEYLEIKLNDPDLKMSTDSGIEEFLGHTWLLEELERYGLVKNGAELVQLSFYTHINDAVLAFIDQGVWYNLTDGQLYESLNIRPYKAVKHIREDDSFFDVLKVEKLYFYPGDYYSRIRWESSTSRQLEPADYTRVKISGSPNFNEVLKQIKNVIKNPLSNKYPLKLLKYSRIGLIGDNYVISDGENTHILLVDSPIYEFKTTNMLKYLDHDLLKDQTLMVRFSYDIDRNFLSAQPLSIITDNKIIRLLF